MPRTFINNDAFNRASLGTTDWAQMNVAAAGDVQINSSIRINGQYSTQATDEKATARWIGAGTFTDDQYSSVKIVTAPSNTGSNATVGVCARASGSGATRSFYEAFVDGVNPANTVLVKRVNGVRTQLATTSATTWAAGDFISLEVIGNDLKVYKNTTTEITALAVTDTAITTGAPGVVVSSSAIMGDDWEGGNLGGGSPSLPPLAGKQMTGGFRDLTGGTS